MCAKRRLSSALASAQPDQSLSCPHEENLGPWLPFERTVVERPCHFVGFIMLELSSKLEGSSDQKSKCQNKTTTPTYKSEKGITSVFWEAAIQLIKCQYLICRTLNTASKKVSIFRLSRTSDLNKMSRDMTKPNKMSVRPAKTQITLGIRPV